jgi:hypothetical protein
MRPSSRAPSTVQTHRSTSQRPAALVGLATLIARLGRWSPAYTRQKISRGAPSVLPPQGQAGDPGCSAARRRRRREVEGSTNKRTGEPKVAGTIHVYCVARCMYQQARRTEWAPRGLQRKQKKVMRIYKARVASTRKRTYQYVNLAVGDYHRLGGTGPAAVGLPERAAAHRVIHLLWSCCQGSTSMPSKSAGISTACMQCCSL